MRLSASLAFYTALSMAPLVLLVVGLTGLVMERPQVANQLATQIEGFRPIRSAASGHYPRHHRAAQRHGCDD